MDEDVAPLPGAVYSNMVMLIIGLEPMLTMILQRQVGHVLTIVMMWCGGVAPIPTVTLSLISQWFEK